MGYSGTMSTGGKGGTNPVAAALGVLATKHMLNGKSHEPSMADKDLYAARRHEEAIHMAKTQNELEKDKISHISKTYLETNPNHEIDNMTINSYGGSVKYGKKKEKPVQVSSEDNSVNPEHSGKRGGGHVGDPNVHPPRQFQEVMRRNRRARQDATPRSPQASRLKNKAARKRASLASRGPRPTPTPTPTPSPAKKATKKTTKKATDNKTPKPTEIPKYTGPSVYRNPKTNKIEAHPDLVAHRKKYGIKAPAKKKK